MILKETTSCSNPFCPLCHPNDFYMLQLDQNSLNAIGASIAKQDGRNPLAGIQMRLSQLYDYLEKSCHE